MGHKVNPVGLRLGINRTWDSRWYAGKDYAGLLHEDFRIREYLQDRLRQAGLSKVVIERPAKKARVTLHTARPGVVIGKKGQDIERLRRDLARMTDSDVHLNIVEIRKPEIDAKLVAENVAQQLERRSATFAVAHDAEGAFREALLVDPAVFQRIGVAADAAVELGRLQVGEAHAHLRIFRPLPHANKDPEVSVFW